MGVPQHGWFILENKTKMDDDWGYPCDSGNLHLESGVFWMFRSGQMPGPLKSQEMAGKLQRSPGMMFVLKVGIFIVLLEAKRRCVKPTVSLGRWYSHGGSSTSMSVFPRASESLMDLMDQIQSGILKSDEHFWPNPRNIADKTIWFASPALQAAERDGSAPAVSPFRWRLLESGPTDVAQLGIPPWCDWDSTVKLRSGGCRLHWHQWWLHHRTRQGVVSWLFLGRNTSWSWGFPRVDYWQEIHQVPGLAEQGSIGLAWCRQQQRSWRPQMGPLGRGKSCGIPMDLRV